MTQKEQNKELAELKKEMSDVFHIIGEIQQDAKKILGRPNLQDEFTREIIWSYLSGDISLKELRTKINQQK